MNSDAENIEETTVPDLAKLRTVEQRKYLRTIVMLGLLLKEAEIEAMAEDENGGLE